MKSVNGSSTQYKYHCLWLLTVKFRGILLKIVLNEPCLHVLSCLHSHDFQFMGKWCSKHLRIERSTSERNVIMRSLVFIRFFSARVFLESMIGSFQGTWDYVWVTLGSRVQRPVKPLEKGPWERGCVQLNKGIDVTILPPRREKWTARYGVSMLLLC